MNKRELIFKADSQIEYTCTVCHSNKSLYPGASCPLCKGKGVIVKKVDAGRYIENDCSVCSGTGHNPFNDHACIYCNGTGKVIIKVHQRDKIGIPT